MKISLRKHINSILLTILVHLIVVFIALAFHMRTIVIHTETPLLIEPKMLEEIIEKPVHDDESQNEISDADVENYLGKMTSAGSNYQGTRDNLRDNKELSVDDIRRMYEDEILREKYGNDYNNRVNQNNNSQDDFNYTPTPSDNKNNANQNIDNTNKPCLVKVVLDDKKRATRYLHIPVFTCRGSGTVEIGISISQEGKVIATKLISVNAGNDSDCLTQAAIAAAKKSRFAIIDSKNVQSGVIIYTFMTQ